MSPPRKFMLFPTLVLVAGGLVYLLWRSPTLWMFDWCEALGFGKFLGSLRIVAAQHEPPGWVLYSFPDGAWAFAGTATMRWIWTSVTGVQRAIWISLVPVLAIGSEVGQGFGFVRGDFDFNDLTTCLVAVSLAFLIKPTHTSHDITI